MRRSGTVLVAAALLALIDPTPAPAQDAGLERFVRAQDPVSMAWTPDGSRLFFDEQATGDVRVATADGTVLPRPFAHLDVDASGETGLLGIAIDPGFPAEPWVYVYYSDPTLGNNRLVRFRADGDVAASPPQILLEGLLTANRYHNGGDLVFGTDGMLYVTVGEGHLRWPAQDPNSVGGKVLRLEPDGSVPQDNPIPGNPLFTLGHRNSFGICVDPATGDVWETENGPTSDDEVNLLRPGGNYGWPDVIGRRRTRRHDRSGDRSRPGGGADRVRRVARRAVLRDVPGRSDPAPRSPAGTRSAFDPRDAGGRARLRPHGWPGRPTLRVLTERDLAGGGPADRNGVGAAIGQRGTISSEMALDLGDARDRPRRRTGSAALAEVAGRAIGRLIRSVRFGLPSEPLWPLASVNGKQDRGRWRSDPQVRHRRSSVSAASRAVPDHASAPT